MNDLIRKDLLVLKIKEYAEVHRQTSFYTIQEIIEIIESLPVSVTGEQGCTCELHSDGPQCLAPYLDLDYIQNEIMRASGVLSTLYAMVKDYCLNSIVEPDKNCKLDDVLSDTINGLTAVVSNILDAKKGGCHVD